MTKSPRCKEARAAIAKWLCARFDGMPWDSQPAYRRESYFADADALLSLKDPTGKPYLAVVSADQSWPDPKHLDFGPPYLNGHRDAQIEAQDAGFVKVEKP